MNTIYLVRHGENRANLTKEFSYKVVDYSLTPKGALQAQQTAQFFQDKQIHEVYTSPLKRAPQLNWFPAISLWSKLCRSTNTSAQTAMAVFRS